MIRIVEVGEEEARLIATALRSVALRAHEESKVQRALGQEAGVKSWGMRSSVFQTLAGRWLGIANELRAKSLLEDAE